MKINLPYAVIDSATCDRQFFKDVKFAYKKNLKFFGRSPGKVKIKVCNTKAEWKKACKYYYYPVATGVVLRDGTIVVKSRKLAQRSRARYRKLICHEMNHVFWINLCSRKGRLWQPLWVCEGLACMVAEDSFVLSKKKLQEIIKKRKVGPNALTYSFQAKDLSSRSQVVLSYSIWTHFLAYLNQERTGKIKLFLKMLKGVRNRKAYDRVFYELFGDVASKFNQFAKT